MRRRLAQLVVFVIVAATACAWMLWHSAQCLTVSTCLR